MSIKHLSTGFREYTRSSKDKNKQTVRSRVYWTPNKSRIHWSHEKNGYSKITFKMQCELKCKCTVLFFSSISWSKKCLIFRSVNAYCWLAESLFFCSASWWVSCLWSKNELKLQLVINFGMVSIKCSECNRLKKSELISETRAKKSISHNSIMIWIDLKQWNL